MYSSSTVCGPNGLFHPMGAVSFRSGQPRAGTPSTSGAIVSLTSGNTSVAQVPSTVTVPAGARSGTFTVTTGPEHGTYSIRGTYLAGGAKRHPDRAMTVKGLPQKVNRLFSQYVQRLSPFA